MGRYYIGEEIDSAAASLSASESCFISRMSGTSMATPIAAGAAALVRQYFTNGFYPSGAHEQEASG